MPESQGPHSSSLPSAAIHIPSLSTNGLSPSRLLPKNQPETKVQRSGKQIIPIKKKKSTNKDTKDISSPEIIVSNPDTIISGFDTIVSGFEIENISGHEYLYILTKKIFFPTRWQNISNKKCPTFKAPGKPSAFIGYRPVVLLVLKS